MIVIDSVSLKRGGAEVLTGVSAGIAPGGITAIIGPNGAGKSTLLHVIAGLIAPDAGKVTVDGADIHALKERERALRLALLPQDSGTAPRLTVADLVGFGRWPRHRGRPDAADHAAVAEAMARFELGPLAGRDVGTLSGGQRQRAFVAMTHAQGTPWILLDEPLAALDPRYSRDIMERLAALSQGEDARSVVLVVHDLTAAARWAGHVIAMKDGRITHAGPTEAVMTSQNLTALYDTPLRRAEAEGHPVVVAD